MDSTQKFKRFLLRLRKRKHPIDTFTRIYKKNAWGGVDSVSGRGSDHDQTVMVKEIIRHVIQKFNITSILDIPCGDFNWMKDVNYIDVAYTGADIVDAIVDNNIKLYGNNNIRFRKLDLTRDALPTVDLILCRDCLVHMPFDDISLAVQNIRYSKAKYLMVTTFPSREENINIITGQWRPLNMQLEPFMFPDPVEMFNEGCTESNGLYADKSLGLWEIKDIPN